MKPSEPFKRWNLDFVGPLPETKNGNRYILVAIDSFTKWSIAKAMPEATAHNVAKFIYEEILMNYACPSEIITDRGAQFMAEVVEDYLQKQNVKHLKSSAFHPRTNGQVENLNKFIKQMLSKYVMDFPTRWDSFLQQVVFASRVRCHSATKFSPLRLVYGVEPQLPGDVIRPFLFDETNEEETMEYRIKELESLGQDRAAALERAHLNMLRMKKQFDTNVKPQEYSVGDYVWLKNMTRKALETKYIGPYRVLNVCPLGTFQLVKRNGDIKNDLVHKDRIKLANLDQKEKSLFSQRSDFLVQRTKEIYGLN